MRLCSAIMPSSACVHVEQKPGQHKDLRRLFSMQGFSLTTSGHSVQPHAEEQAAAVDGHPAAGAAAAGAQCRAVPDGAASDATLQSLLTGALATADAAAGPNVQLHGGQAQRPVAMPGGVAVPWLPPGPLSSWHGYQGGAVPHVGPARLRPGTLGGLPPAGQLPTTYPTQDNGPSGAINLRWYLTELQGAGGCGNIHLVISPECVVSRDLRRCCS